MNTAEKSIQVPVVDNIPVHNAIVWDTQAESASYWGISKKSISSYKAPGSGYVDSGQVKSAYRDNTSVVGVSFAHYFYKELDPEYKVTKNERTPIDENTMHFFPDTLVDAMEIPENVDPILFVSPQNRDFWGFKLKDIPLEISDRKEGTHSRFVPHVDLNLLDAVFSQFDDYGSTFVQVGTKYTPIAATEEPTQETPEAPEETAATRLTREIQTVVSSGSKEAQPAAEPEQIEVLPEGFVDLVQEMILDAEVPEAYRRRLLEAYSKR